MRSVKVSLLFLVLAVGLVGFKWQTKEQFTHGLRNNQNDSVNKRNTKQIDEEKLNQTEASLETSSNSKDASSVIQGLTLISTFEKGKLFQTNTVTSGGHFYVVVGNN